MTKLSYNETLEVKQKDMERLLWEVFWSYAQELGLEESKERREEMLERMQSIMPDFAESIVRMDVYFDYPVIHLFLTSLHLGKNLLQSEEFRPVLEAEGPGNDAKLYMVVNMLKQKGVLWQ